MQLPGNILALLFLHPGDLTGIVAQVFLSDMSLCDIFQNLDRSRDLFPGFVQCLELGIQDFAYTPALNIDNIAASTYIRYKISVCDYYIIYRNGRFI